MEGQAVLGERRLSKLSAIRQKVNWQVQLCDLDVVTEGVAKRRTSKCHSFGLCVRARKRGGGGVVEDGSFNPQVDYADGIEVFRRRLMMMTEVLNRFSVNPRDPIGHGIL